MNKLLLCYYFLLIVVASGCVTQPTKREILNGERIETCIKRMGNNWSLETRHKVCSDTWQIRK